MKGGESEAGGGGISCPESQVEGLRGSLLRGSGKLRKDLRRGVCVTRSNLLGDLPGYNTLPLHLKECILQPLK